MASAAARPSAIACPRAAARPRRRSPARARPRALGRGVRPSPLADEHDEVRGHALRLARQPVSRDEALLVDRLGHEERAGLEPGAQRGAGRAGSGSPRECRWRTRPRARQRDLRHARLRSQARRRSCRATSRSRRRPRPGARRPRCPKCPAADRAVVVTARSLPGRSGRTVVAPRGEDELVGGRQVVATGTGAEPELHPLQLETRRVEVENPPPAAAVRREHGDARAPPTLVAGLEDRHSLAAPTGERERALEAGGACADDAHGAAVAGRRVPRAAASPGAAAPGQGELRVDGAQQRRVEQAAVLVAAHARPDLARRAPRAACAGSAVGDQRPRDADEVGALAERGLDLVARTEGMRDDERPARRSRIGSEAPSSGGRSVPMSLTYSPRGPTVTLIQSTSAVSASADTTAPARRCRDPARPTDASRPRCPSQRADGGDDSSAIACVPRDRRRSRSTRVLRSGERNCASR